MNGSKGNAAFNASEMPERRDVVFNLNTAHRMLPLVQRVVGESWPTAKCSSNLQPEQARLDRQKRDLVWQERQRRYQLHEEVAVAERHLQDALEELHDLGLTVLSPKWAESGFPPGQQPSSLFLLAAWRRTL